MDRKQVEDLLERYKKGTCTDEEAALVESVHIRRYDNSGNHTNQERKEALWAKLQTHLRQSKNSQRTIRLWPRSLSRVRIGIAAAAVVLIALGFGTYYFFVNYTGSNNPPVVGHGQQQITNNDIEPGGNRATLTLADGRKIMLDEAANGELVEESGIRITKTEDGQLVYEILRHAPQARASEGTDARITDARQPKAGSAGWRTSVRRDPATYNTIQTPRGGQYKIILPDSSVVWLNAASSLRYPTRFSGAERRVELTGEAFFQVKRKKVVETQHIAPFIVATAAQEVTVLGTQFNISAYEDEASVKTTLLEGSVRVVSTSVQPTNQPINQSTTLRPGQQSTLLGNSLAVVDVEVEESTAWKNGLFNFNRSSFEEVMRQLARWYDIEVIYENGVPDIALAGEMERNLPLSTVLRILEKTKVKFRMEPGRKLHVLN